MTHEGIEITVVMVTQEDDYSLRVFTLKVNHSCPTIRKMNTRIRNPFQDLSPVGCKYAVE